MTRDQIEEIVHSCPKQRFGLAVNDLGQQVIRANQGHSIAQVSADALLQPLTDPDQFPTVVHGTNEGAWKLISKQGLSRMGRNHVHFATGLPGEDGVISGMRARSTVLIYLNVPACLRDGIPLFISENSVVLCPGAGDTGTIPPQYFSKVVHR